mgnify:CR=1
MGILNSVQSQLGRYFPQSAAADTDWSSHSQHVDAFDNPAEWVDKTIELSPQPDSLSTSCWKVKQGDIYLRCLFTLPTTVTACIMLSQTLGAHAL